MIKVIDSLMGSGKTTYIIRFMNANPEGRYLFVSPYLAEAERIARECPSLHFKQPTDAISKTVSLKMLLAEGENIVISHELFSRQELTPKLYSMIQEYGYMLILDEVLEVVQPIQNIKKSEVEMLFAQGWIEADESGQVHWIHGNEPVSRFLDIRAKAQSKSLYWYDEKLLLWILPMGLLQAFTQVVVLTFLFAGSHLKHFFDLYSMEYAYSHVREGVLHDGLPNMKESKRGIAALIDLYQGT